MQSHMERLRYKAVEKGRKDIVRFLLGGGADPKKANNYRLTPLFWAAEKGHQDVVQLLLDRGVDPNKADVFVRTPLHMAAMQGGNSIA